MIKSELARWTPNGFALTLIVPASFATREPLRLDQRFQALHEAERRDPDAHRLGAAAKRSQDQRGFRESGRRQNCSKNHVTKPGC